MRLAQGQDVHNIMNVVWGVFNRSPAPQMKVMTPIDTELTIRTGIHEKRAFIVEGVFILVDVGIMPFSSKRVLFEQLVLKLQPDGNVKAAVAALDDIARSFSCSHIAVGDTQIGKMVPYYESAGYAPLGVQLFKEVTHGMAPQDIRHSATD